ncbi:LuxR family transcriptional regulator [Streptomyces sp. M92]|uniref:LuxR family transcriptional regulator n=1 Tax=Streptomyces sp. M92 TaxID=2944250 RepID=UPI002349412F|nr:LuxR family transcriptional regulator [Streptomyces sp. M92]WCN04118.1 LuxR C-terminal-related transcriptional regulator [Streptomyces sp. M92]
MIISGDQGLGKTRFLESASQYSVKAGLEVIRLKASGLSVISLRCLLDDLLDAPTLERFADRWSDWVDFYHPGDNAKGPVLLALDDVDGFGSTMWAVPAVRSVGRRLGRPLVVLMSCTHDSRDWFQTDDDSQAQQLTDSTVAVVRCRLLPLPREAIEQIAAEALGMRPSREIMDICSHAGGVPARLMPLLDGVIEAGVIQGADGAARLAPKGVLPPQAWSLALAQFTGLSSGTRQMVDVGSVLGRSFSLRTLSFALGRTELNLLPSIREARDAGVLVEDDSCVSFTDALVWHAARENVPIPVRGAILREVGRRLLITGETDAFGDEYLLRAARLGDRLAAAGLPDALMRRAKTDPVTAAELAAQALQLPLMGKEAQLGLWQIRVDGLIFSGRVVDAMECLANALEQPLEPEAVDVLRIRLPLLQVFSGNVEAAAELHRLLERSDSPHAQEWGTLLADRLSHRTRDACLEQRFGLKPASRTHPDELTGRRLLGSSQAWCDGRVQRSLDLLGEDAGASAMRICNGQIPPFLTRVTRIQYLVSLRQFADAETELRAVVADIEEHGSHGWRAATESLRALLALEQGDTETAVEAATAGLDLAERYGAGMLALLAHAVLTIASLRRMQLLSARKHTEMLGDPLSIDRSGGVTQPALWAVLMMAEANDGPRAATALAERLLSERVTPCAMLLFAPYAAPWLVRTALAAERPEFAARTVAAAQSLAEGNRNWPVVAAAADHARWLLGGDANALQLTADLHRDPWARAQLEEDLGRATEDRNIAVRHLQRAAQTYARAGASRDAARVRQSLRSQGVRRRHWKNASRPDTGWAALTDTERAVAHLVAAGMTNRQAAQQMFLSPHTVNFHLRNIYRKLEIASRVNLAAIVTTRREGVQGVSRNYWSSDQPLPLDAASGE